MKIVCFACILSFAGSLFAATDETAKVLTSIAEFRAHPLTEEGRVAAGKIIKFAEQSEAVSIRIAKPLMPWLHDYCREEKYRAMLLGAYLAGNVKAQLDRGVNKDDPYAGMLVVFDVYRQIKEENKNCRIPEIETFLDLESKKKLKAHLEKLLQAELKKENPDKPSKP
jgi:hypothetical protein